VKAEHIYGHKQQHADTNKVDSCVAKGAAALTVTVPAVSVGGKRSKVETIPPPTWLTGR